MDNKIYKNVCLPHGHKYATLNLGVQNGVICTACGDPLDIDVSKKGRKTSANKSKRKK